MKFIKSKKGVALLATLAVAAIAAVGAFAYFSSTGHGSGAAKVGTSTAFTIASDAYTGGPLTPAGGPLTYESVKFRVTNPSSGAQNLNQVVVSVAGTDGLGAPSTFSIAGTGGNPACTNGDFQLSVDNGTTWGAAGSSVTDTSNAADLAAGATSGDGTVLIRMIDTGANQDACQTADVPLYFAAS
jgi:hypothetical protein